MTPVRPGLRDDGTPVQPGERTRAASLVVAEVKIRNSEAAECEASERRYGAEESANFDGESTNEEPINLGSPRQER